MKLKYVIDFIPESCDPGVKVYDSKGICVAVHMKTRNTPISMILEILGVKDNEVEDRRWK